MSHRFLEGTVRHRRRVPSVHDFSYRFFMLDIDVERLESLENVSLLSYNAFNLFAFDAKDHFGRSRDFRENVRALLASFGLEAPARMRFVTLPRIVGFVFNPISLLILCNERDEPQHLLAEVHNYNGGRIVYDVALEPKANGALQGRAAKQMHVSPFFERDGEYAFTLRYDEAGLEINIRLDENGEHKLNTHMRLHALAFRTSTVSGLFFRHTLLTIWVVTRTLWQSFKLWRKGLQWRSPIPADQIRRY